MLTPRMRTPPTHVQGVTWAADNGCFASPQDYSDDMYFGWLEDMIAHRDRCLFAVAPDVLGDHEATWERSRSRLPMIRHLRYPVAYVAQNGATVANLPWREFDVLFIGGNDDWRHGPGATELIIEARTRHYPVHFGRVNGVRRLRSVAGRGATSADGTYLAFGPDKNWPNLRRWVLSLNQQRSFWSQP